MKITIHQPDFMPWYGFFNKIAKSDLWIVLDHVENNPRDSKFWGRRVQMLVNGSPKWISIPLIKPKNRICIPINEMLINLNEDKNLNKLYQTIIQSYTKSPYFKKYKYLIDTYFTSKEDSLLKNNFKFIEDVLNILDINTKIVYSSDYNLKTHSNELLLDLLKLNNASIYLCGAGASSYQNDRLYEENNIKIEYNSFIHPEYEHNNTNDFFQGLSIIDMLFNCDIKYLKKIINS